MMTKKECFWLKDHKVMKTVVLNMETKQHKENLPNLQYKPRASVTNVCVTLRKQKSTNSGIK